LSDPLVCDDPIAARRYAYARAAADDGDWAAAAKVFQQAAKHAPGRVPAKRSAWRWRWTLRMRRAPQRARLYALAHAGAVVADADGDTSRQQIASREYGATLSILVLAADDFL
jgi:hypothetical protein